MLQRTAILPVLFACGAAMCRPAPVLAGDVNLVSDTWDKVCRLEITWGAKAPGDTPVEQYLDVPRNWSVTRPERLCYRRASTPDNCDSGMTQWNTPWKCAAREGPGVEKFSLE